ncbi:hypothetical protein Poly30_28550 [Planctomycetes bacterium Poly30]|uniref:FG-GAP repeat protein n=1 Tax=Saltatorellus ferox TaxID=2528018 RepID=A0A518ETB2_9BACT|nr:hypothetical protein Poly30_28550 [Planctomycetes bacterium Poly30]
MFSRLSLTALPAALALTLFTAAPAHAQFCDTELIPGFPEVSAQAGSSVSLSGTLAAIGSPFASGGLSAPGTNGAGSVSLFEQSGGEWSLTTTLFSPNPEPEGQFGYDVAIEGDLLLVGAPFEDSGAVNSGRTYLYRRIGGAWTLTDTILELSQSQESRFGHSVSVSGTRLAISAIRSSFFGPSAGAAYFYRAGGGSVVFEDRVGPNPVTANGFFGTSVSLSGSICAVGAVFDGAIANNEGSAYVFERQPNSTWNQYAKVVPPVSQSSAFFGVAVKLVGGVLVVGAEGINNGASSGRSGSAFVFRDQGNGSYGQEAELGSPTPISNGNFGRAVTLAPGRIAVAEIGGGGAVHTYVRVANQWTYEQTILGLNHMNGDGFGTDVGLIGDALLVGAPTRSTSIPVSGAAFVYDLDFEDCNANGLNDFCEIATTPGLDCDSNGLLDTCEIAAGTGVDCNANWVLDSCEIAAQSFLDCDSNGVLDTCEISTNPGLDCNSNQRLDVCDIADGTEPDVNGNLVPDGCESVGFNPGCQTINNSTGVVGGLTAFGIETALANDIVLVASDIPLNTFGYPIVSRMSAQVIPPGAAGFRCVGGSVGRDYGNIFNTMQTGGALLPIDLTAIPSPSGLITATAGETWYWQLWHRDSFGGALTSTFTDSIIFTFQ